MIQSRDIYNNPRWGGGDNYTVFIWDPNAKKAEDWVVTVAQSIEDLGDSTYRVTYFPTRAGDFLMEVVLGDHLNFALGEVLQANLEAPIPACCLPVLKYDA